ANYHSLQATINRRLTRGLFVKGAYTYSRAINWTDDDGWAGVMWNHPSVLNRNRAPAGYDIPHIFQLGFIGELPLGRGKRWAPGAVNLDLSVFRKFPLKERFGLEFRTEIFNFTNTPHFGAPQSNVSVGNFMTITSAEPDERQFRFGLRLEF